MYKKDSLAWKGGRIQLPTDGRLEIRNKEDRNALYFWCLQRNPHEEEDEDSRIFGDRSKLTDYPVQPGNNQRNHKGRRVHKITKRLWIRYSGTCRPRKI